MLNKITINAEYKDFELILPSFKCDKNCPYCSAKITRWPQVDLDLEVFKKKLAALKQAGVKFKYFILCGNGEPSLYPLDTWREIFQIVEDYRTLFQGVRVQTSGHLFYEPEKIALLPTDALVEITRVYLDSSKDMQCLGYPKDYITTSTFKQCNIRLNYVVLKDKNAQNILDEITEYTKTYSNIKTVSIKTLNLNTLDSSVNNPYSQWILDNACTRSNCDSLLKELSDYIGNGIVEYKDRTVWQINGLEVTLYAAKGEHYGDTHVVFYGNKLVNFKLEEFVIEDINVHTLND